MEAIADPPPEIPAPTQPAETRTGGRGRLEQERRGKPPERDGARSADTHREGERALGGPSQGSSKLVEPDSPGAQMHRTNPQGRATVGPGVVRSGGQIRSVDRWRGQSHVDGERPVSAHKQRGKIRGKKQNAVRRKVRIFQQDTGFWKTPPSPPLTPAASTTNPSGARDRAPFGFGTGGARSTESSR